MIVATRKPARKVECGCGAMVASRGLPLHETSRAHKVWANQPSTASEPVDATLLAALAARDRGDDPRAIAKMVRSVFTRLDWPDDAHPGSQVDFLAEHGIPIITLPRHIDSSDATRYVADWIDVLKASAWGKPDWNLATFEANWNKHQTARAQELLRQSRAAMGA